MMVVIIIEGGQGHRLAVSLFENMEIGKIGNTDFADEDPPARIQPKSIRSERVVMNPAEVRL